MSRWCEGFRQQYNRAPKWGLDKVRISQADIRRDRQRSPIFFAACNTLVVCGSLSYTQRLWCCVELFVYVKMLAEDNTRDAAVLLPLFANDEEFVEMREFRDPSMPGYVNAPLKRTRTASRGVIDRNPGEVLALKAFIRDFGVVPSWVNNEERLTEEAVDVGDRLLMACCRGGPD